MRAIIEAAEDNVNITPVVMTDFLCALQGNFANRFSDFNIDKNIIKFVKNPFTWKVPDEMSKFLRFAGLHIDEGNFHMELIDLKEFSEQNDHFVRNEYQQFWADTDSTTYPNLKNIVYFFDYVWFYVRMRIGFLSHERYQMQLENKFAGHWTRTLS